MKLTPIQAEVSLSRSLHDKIYYQQHYYRREKVVGKLIEGRLSTDESNMIRKANTDFDVKRSL